MIELFRKKRIAQYEKGANEYISRTYEPVSLPQQKKPNIQYSLREPGSEIQDHDRETVRYSLCVGSDDPQHQDRFCPETIEKLFSDFSLNNQSITDGLDNALNMTFVDMLTLHIHRKGWRDSKVYKAAQIDRRLFSKMMSDRAYKPAKDTALALAIALELTLQQTSDLLERAGYTLSHSNKRDVIIEYFIREGVHNLIDINEVLHKLDQKMIGR